MNNSSIDCPDVNNTANKLFKDISNLIESTQQQTLRKISQTGVLLYWHIGQRVNYDILDSERAKYGAGIIDTLADKLQIKFGSSFGRRVIYRCIQFAKLFPDEQIVISLSNHLKWSHFVFLLNIENKLKREFYAEMCRIERWSISRLKEKLSSMLFERTAIAKKPESIIKKEIIKLRKTDILKPDFIMQDPVILQYLSNQQFEDERSFEDAIVSDIQQFLLSMGTGFTFQERQKVIEIDGDFFKIDLLMFNRQLKCMTAIELKMGAFKPADKGQIELYLRWLEKYEMLPGENPPIGIILCAEKSDERVELLQLNDSGIRVCQFMT
ncbi:MAG: PDDEXK nuclease domain-containing protein [Gammaproteobacteria bacterium]|jgi:predicted nuclease of restriction endonuclease-like (RecB) superfamily